MGETIGVGVDDSEMLRRLVVADDRLTSAPFSESSRDADSFRSLSIAKFAALVGVGGSVASYSSAADAAIGAGVTRAELVEVLVALIPVVGVPRAVAAARQLALALGLDLETFVDDVE